MDVEQLEEQRAELDDIFDVLLRRSLQAYFGAAVSEPVPDHLQQLILEHAAELPPVFLDTVLSYREPRW